MVQIKLSLISGGANEVDPANPSLRWLRKTPMDQWPPIILDEGNHVIDGVHRVFVAKELGATKINVVYESELFEMELRKIYK